jgi:hypothetical protein
MDGAAGPTETEVLEIYEHHLGDALLSTDIWRLSPPILAQCYSSKGSAQVCPTESL